MHDLSTGAQQVLDALTEIGHGTVAEIREKTGKSARVTDKAIKELADASLITATDPGDGNPARWGVTAPATEPTDPDTATGTDPATESDTGTATAPDEPVNLGDGDPAQASDPGQPDQQNQPPGPNTEQATGNDPMAADDIPADTAGGDGSDDGCGQPADDTADDSAEELEQTPARPKPPADRRVLTVAGVLGDYPDGATIDEISEATGYKYGAVALLLQAMEQGDAARRIPEDTEAGTPQRWQPGPGKAIEVDPNPAPPRCPTCHQVIRNSTPKAATATIRSGGSASSTVNADGSEPLGRGVLRAWTEEFINAKPGHEFTPGTIAEALGTQHGRTISSGAVLNNCRTLAMNDQITVVRQEPFTVTANKSAADSATDSDGEQR